MFNDPKVLARSARELVELANQPGLPPSTVAALELGAATLCNHVRDWHVKGGCTPSGHEAFKNAFPAWGALCQISNGTKHAKPIIRELGNTELREVGWVDGDFWSADHNRPTLFVKISGEQRAVSALVWQFVSDYLEKSGEPTRPDG